MILKNSFIRQVIMLATLFILSFGFILSAQAFDGTGIGTIGDPYQVSTCLELQSIENDDTYGLYYELAGDIDCSDTITWNTGLGFDPIESFQGVFDGQGYEISDLYINRTADISENIEVGLFGQISGFVYDLHLEEGTTGEVNGAISDSYRYTGSLAGRIGSDALVVGVTSNVPVSGAVAGGIAGDSNYGFLQQSAYTGTVTGVGTVSRVGGLLGAIQYGGSVDDSYADAILTGNTVGGIIGEFTVSGNNVPLNNSYATGSLMADTAGGGLVGTLIENFGHEINNSFSNMTLGGAGVLGGIAGISTATGGLVSNSYFDTVEAGTSNCIATNTSTVTTTCLTWNSVASASYLIFNNTDAPLDTWNFTDTWVLEAASFPLLMSVPEAAVPDDVSDLVVVYDALGVEYDYTWTGNEGSSKLPLGKYDYQVQLAGGDWSSLLDNDDSDDSVADFSDYYIGFDYDLRVRANNAYGPGDWVETSFTAEANADHNISTCLELMAIDETAETEKDAYYLTQDIDCTGVDFDPIGGESWDEFEGLFDGQGYTISNLAIDQEDSGIGLFRVLESAVIRDLTIEGSVIGDETVGSLAGYAVSVYIENVTVNVDVTGDEGAIGGLFGEVYTEGGLSATISQVRSLGSVTTEDGDGAGGLIGYLEVYEEGVITVSESYASGDVSGYAYVGGLIGEVYSEGYDNDGAFIYITDSYASGDAVGTDYDIGGLLGHVESYDDDEPAGIIISNVYASGDVSGPDPTGGLIAHADGPEDEEDEYIIVEHSFATGSVTGEEGDEEIGGIFGSSDDDGGLIVDNLFWDVTLSGIAVCDGDEDEDIIAECTGVTDSSYFADSSNQPFDGNWDTEDVWYFSGSDYPVLRALT